MNKPEQVLELECCLRGSAKDSGLADSPFKTMKVFKAWVTRYQPDNGYHEFWLTPENTWYHEYVDKDTNEKVGVDLTYDQVLEVASTMCYYA